MADNIAQLRCTRILAIEYIASLRSSSNFPKPLSA
jgi:hypothetical protein